MIYVSNKFLLRHLKYTAGKRIIFERNDCAVCNEREVKDGQYFSPSSLEIDTPDGEVMKVLLVKINEEP